MRVMRRSSKPIEQRIFLTEDKMPDYCKQICDKIKFDYNKSQSAMLLSNSLEKWLDEQRDPLLITNSMNKNFGVDLHKKFSGYTGEYNKDYIEVEIQESERISNIFAHKALREYMTIENASIEAIMKKATGTTESLIKTFSIGRYVVTQEVNTDKKKADGSKSKMASEIYLEYRDKKTDKEIVSLLEKQLEVTRQNAYTYLYNIKRKLAKL